ncbi:MAG: aa3-type cytochrome c oxidase subunit IV [Pseudomonadota bacterium]|nr:aa3-type cytochrome c oxidase subunit IV [Pseudomonadota bacterium]
MAADRPIDREPIDYTIGSMDITEQVATFNVIMRLVKWVSLGIAALLLMLTVWFGTAAGFFTAFASAAALIIVGFFLLRAKNKSDAPHETGPSVSAAAQRNEGWTTQPHHS